MGLKWRKFRLLMWKNWLIFYRAPCRIIFIVLFPVLCSLFAKIGRTIAETDHHLEMYYNNFCTFPIKGPPCDSEEKPDSFSAFQNYRNFCVLYSPAAPAADRIMTYFKSAFSDVRRMQNSHELNTKAFIQGNPNLFAAVEFDESISEGQNSLPDNVKITIRMPTFLRYNESLTWRTDTFLPKSFTLGPREPEAMTCAFPNYHIEGFLALQHFITMMVIAEKKNVPPPKNPEDPNDWKEVASKLTSWKVPFIYMQRYPNAEYYEDTYLTRFKFIIPYLVLIGFLTPFTVTVYMITLEKEKQLKETMKIIGVSNWLHWTSWFLTMLVIFAIVAFLVTVILKAHVSGDYPMIDLTSGLMLYVFVICYCCSLFTYAFAVSVLFSTTTMAVILSIAFFFLATVPVFVVAHGFEMMLPLFPNAAFCYGLGAIMDLEILGLGLQIKNLFKTVIPGTLFAPGTIMLMLLVDSLLFMLIALYIEAIRPGKYGVGKYWFFLCMPKFWLREKKVNGNYSQRPEGVVQNSGEVFEKEPTGKIGVSAKNLGTFFGTEEAVKGLTLNMFEGQTTVLVGHTGAGKTTTLMILTGMYPSTSGSATVNGYNIRTEIDGVRSSLGLCPQHNIIFNELTVKEHLYFFSSLKGLDQKATNEEINKILDLLNLRGKRSKLAKKLSPSLKRKLSVGIAFCGKPKVVILDEPSTGMDVAAQRTLWDLILTQKTNKHVHWKYIIELVAKFTETGSLANRKPVVPNRRTVGNEAMEVAVLGHVNTEPTFSTRQPPLVSGIPRRTVLLTTSSMNEADLLGDRIAIMVKGELKCCGSSNFLKKKYGTGYYLIIEKGPNCDPSNITALLRKHIPNTSIISNTGTELTYSMPEDQTNLFELTLKELESRSKELAIERFVMSLTTLEEVFKKVRIESNGKQHNTTEPLDYIQNTPTVSHTGNIGSVYATGCTLTKNQYKAMFIKRYICTRGSWVLMLTAFLIPTIFTGFGLISLTAPSAARALPPITLSLDSLDDPVILYQMEQVKPPLIYAFEKAYKTKRVDDIDKYTRKLSATDPGKLKLKHMVGLNVYEAQTKSFIFTFPQVVVVWFGNDPYHAPAISLGVALNAIYKMALDCDSCNLQFVNYPLPVAAASKVKNANKTEESAKLMHMFLAFGLFFTSCLFIFPIVQERACEAKYQQFVAGLKVYVYWTAIFIWDLMIWSVIVLVVEISLFLIFQLEGYRSFEELGRLYLLMLLLGWALLPLCYFFGFMFTSTTSALIWCVGYHYFFGYTADSAYKFLTNDLNISVADIVCLWFPHYAFTVGLENLYHMAKIEGVCQKVQESCHASQEMFEQCSKDNSAIIMACSHLERNYFKFKSPGIGAVCMMMFINGLVTFLLIILVDMRFFSSLKSIFYVFCCRLKPIKNELEDDDVARERQKIQTTSIKTLTNNNMIVVKDMTKFFGPKLVVNNVCLTIEKSECFGLLGEKGAGKSTMIKMMNGDISMTSGQAWVAGYSVKRNMKDVQRYIGYCPQNDAILGALTPRQTLLIFALIRGVKPESMRSTIKTLAKEFDFEAYLDTPIKHICGGNKRKVSTAVALMGNPYVIYLDEPTAGMDPTTKRYLVNNLAKIRASGKCIVMTSHNLEDVEELCSRIAIMVNGRLQCLGSVQELKEKFAKGCFITIKIRRVERRVQLEEPSAIPSTIQLETYMAEILPTAVLMYEHADTLIFKLEDPSMPWSTLFGIMENLKRRAHLNIDNYSIIQNGLEQIFVSVLSTLNMRRNK